MVARLTSFSIYLFDESEDLELGRAIRPFVRVTDTNGIANVLDPNATDVVKSVVSEDIWDLQISYLGYTAFSAADRETDPDLYYFAGTVKGKDTETIITTSTDGDQLLLDLKNRLIKQIDLNVVTLTGKFGGQGKADETLPIMGDRQVADQLPVGKYAVKISGFSVELRNFNGIL